MAESLSPEAASVADEVCTHADQQQLVAIAYQAIYCAAGLQSWETLERVIEKAYQVGHRAEVAQARRGLAAGVR